MHIPTTGPSRQANLLGALALALVDRIGDELRQPGERGLTPTAALIHLRLRPGRNIDFLARVLGVSHAAAVRVVGRLEDEGLVERRPSRDGRERALVLTRSGERAARAALAARLDRLAGVLAPRSAAERGQLERLVEKLLVGLTSDRWSARHTC